MQESNGSQGPSIAPSGPDFNAELSKAQASGDFDFVLTTARNSHRMLVDFREAVLTATFTGRDAQTIAVGLQFLGKMIENSASQLQMLKLTEKASREAAKLAQGPEQPPGDDDARK